MRHPDAVQLAFRKVEGLGNDFLLLDHRSASLAEIDAQLDRLRAAAGDVCDRRRGVGGDGILLVGPPKNSGSHATMWVVNHDGTQPEMCGNGLRCVALVVARALEKTELVIDTDAGPKACRVAPDRGHVVVDMGPGVDEGEVRPAGQERVFARVSMGNPHAVAFVSAPEEPRALAYRDGIRLEHAPEFPARTNVEFAHVRADGSIELWVWERGCGVTDACGTGACATACAAVWAGKAAPDQPIAVDLPGGRLEITVSSDARAGVIMAGPARVVFDGSVVI